VRVQRVGFFKLAAVHGLVGAFNLDGNGGLAAFADLDGLVVALNARTGIGLVFRL
jgi:hypothetical protein